MERKQALGFSHVCFFSLPTPHALLFTQYLLNLTCTPALQYLRLAATTCQINFNNYLSNQTDFVF